MSFLSHRNRLKHHRLQIVNQTRNNRSNQHDEQRSSNTGLQEGNQKQVPEALFRQNRPIKELQDSTSHRQINNLIRKANLETCLSTSENLTTRRSTTCWLTIEPVNCLTLWFHLSFHYQNKEGSVLFHHNTIQASRTLRK